MTKHDLINAYVSGGIGRRDFITRLTATGVSAGAALAYAHTLAPSAAAAPTRPSGGFVVRAQDDDGDYGGPILGFPETIAEAIEAVIAFLNALADALQDILDAFSAADFGFVAVPGEIIIPTLQDFADELGDQVSALEATGNAPSSAAKSALAAPSIAFAPLTQTDSAEEALTKLSQRYTILDGYYAGAVPALDDADARLNLMAAALLNSAQGAFIRTALGEDPTPAAIIDPIPLDEAELLLDELDA